MFKFLIRSVESEQLMIRMTNAWYVVCSQVIACSISMEFVGPSPLSSLGLLTLKILYNLYCACERF